MYQNELFEAQFLDIFIDLRNDKVPNVKLALAEIVRKHNEQKGPLSGNQKFMELLNVLKSDPDEEISSVFEE